MSAPLTLALIAGAVLAAQLVRAYRTDPRLVERWVRTRGLELTPETRPVVARYLRRARVLRTWGAAAGVVVPSLASLIFAGRVQVLGFGTDGDAAPLAFGWIFVGYLAGALYAELTVGRPLGGPRRAASLAPRELSGYLSPRLLAGQRAAAAGAAVGLVAMAAVPYPDSISIPATASLVAAAAAVLALGAGLEAVERWLVRRPQPYTGPALVAADNAIRAQSVQAFAGAGLALLLLLCAGVSLALQASDVTVLHWAMIVPAVACLLLGVAAA